MNLLRLSVYLIAFCAISINIYSQNLPDTFKIGDYIDVFDNDSMIIYFSSVGSVVEKRCADYYRIGKIDSVNINVSGQFCDYYMNGEKAFEAVMKNRYLSKILYF